MIGAGIDHCHLPANADLRKSALHRGRLEHDHGELRRPASEPTLCVLKVLPRWGRFPSLVPLWWAR